MLFAVCCKIDQRRPSAVIHASLHTVTGFIGGNSNPTTGDFSFGIMGQLVENGKIIHPVNEMNISGNAKTLWMNLSELGNDPHPYSALKIPTMAFVDINFSGN